MARVFDTYKSSKDLELFLKDNGIPDGHIVVVACKDDCSKALSDTCRDFFTEKMGSKEIYQL